MRRTRWVWAAVAALLLVMVAEVGLSTHQQSPSWDTMYEYDIHLPPVVHGPVLISFADLNGFEFGTKVRNPYQRLFERKPDDVIANGVAVFQGDFTLPEADALGYWHRSNELLQKEPRGALQAAQQAVALVPDGFDGNLALGDAEAALGLKAEAHAAYTAAQRRIEDMEPSAQTQWRTALHIKLSAPAR